MAITLRRLTTVDDAQVEQLADVTIDCVEGGASIGFMLPFLREPNFALFPQGGFCRPTYFYRDLSA